jgi:hypothetical protein
VAICVGATAATECEPISENLLYTVLCFSILLHGIAKFFVQYRLRPKMSIIRWLKFLFQGNWCLCYYCYYRYHPLIVPVCVFVWAVTRSCCAGVCMTVPVCMFVWAVTRSCCAGVCKTVPVCVFVCVVTHSSCAGVCSSVLHDSINKHFAG